MKPVQKWPVRKATDQMIDDIVSTLWTMIEQNVAIICACMPMCRLPLAFLFPTIFGNHSRSQSNYQYGSNDGRSNTNGSQHSRWQPYGGPSKTGGVTHSIVHHSDETSEEYILSSVKIEAPKEGLEAGHRAIRKTTQYEISYENDDTNKA